MESRVEQSGAECSRIERRMEQSGVEQNNEAEAEWSRMQQNGAEWSRVEHKNNISKTPSASRTVRGAS
jgi:hypothetical protein